MKEVEIVVNSVEGGVAENELIFKICLSIDSTYLTIYARQIEEGFGLILAEDSEEPFDALTTEDQAAVMEVVRAQLSEDDIQNLVASTCAMQ